MAEIETYELYGGAIIVHFQEDKHRYTVQHKDEAGIYSSEIWSPSVTGISGQMDKSNWLKPWAVKMAIQSLQKNIKFDTPYNEYELMNFYDEAKAAHKVFAQKAANVGTLVHDWCERFIKAEIDRAPHPDLPTAKLVLRGVDAFRKWNEKMRPEYLFSERIVYSIKRHYLGTFDVGAIIKGEHTLLDFKTSTGIYDEHRIQTAGYIQAANEEYEEQFTQAIILHLSKTTGIPKPYDIEQEGRFDKKLHDIAGWTKVFNNLREVYRDTKERKWNL